MNNLGKHGIESSMDHGIPIVTPPSSQEFLGTTFENHLQNNPSSLHS